MSKIDFKQISNFLKFTKVGFFEFPEFLVFFDTKNGKACFFMITFDYTL